MTTDAVNHPASRKLKGIIMNEITEPLQLAVGSHVAGTGQGCAMNVVSWINGDTIITDYPACSDRFLSHVVQRVNDGMCEHRAGSALLCPPCSQVALDLGLATVGTGNTGLSDLELKRVYARIAVDQAEQVFHLIEGQKQRHDARKMLDASLAWAENPTKENLDRVREVKNAASSSAAAYYAHAARRSAVAYSVAEYAAAVAYSAYSASAAYSAASAAYSASSAAYSVSVASVSVSDVAYSASVAAVAYAAAAASERRQKSVELAWRAIRMFKDLTATNTPTITTPAVKAALANMEKATR